MAEHLNIVTVLEKAISPAERLGMVFDLAKSYAPFFDNLMTCYDQRDPTFIPTHNDDNV